MSGSIESLKEQAWLSSMDSAYLESLAKEGAVMAFEAEDLVAFAKEGTLLRAQHLTRAHPVAKADILKLSPDSERIEMDKRLQFIRQHGYKYANTNPLSSKDTLEAPKAQPGTASAQSRVLEAIYCGTLSLEAYTLPEASQQWCFEEFERLSTITHTESETAALVRSMVAAEGFERYLNSRFPGAKRFSLEGLDSCNALLESLIDQGARDFGLTHCDIGLSHRGRLNALINIVGKSSLALFEEFEGRAFDKNLSGDVKYHQGFSSTAIIHDKPVHLEIAFNPSHLEAVGAIIQGKVRAKQDRFASNKEQVLPIVAHGDSAFAGQGIVMELLNMSQTRGYGTYGTIHIVMDNQVGFTASDPIDTRSTPQCTDIAKMLDIPVIHVNALDPWAMKKAASFALKWRYTFKKDCIIHLIGYRKYGHNEADEPAVTQPGMYKEIRAQEGVLMQMEGQLIAKGLYTEESLSVLKAEYREKLEKGEWLAPWKKSSEATALFDWSPYELQPMSDGGLTGVSMEALKALGQALVSAALARSLHARVLKIYNDRASMYQGKAPLDWGAAEALAFSSLLEIGTPIRLSGQDSKRGTFFQRHCYVVDQETGEQHNIISGKKGSFYAIDSLLSEEAVLGFEYGYAATDPQTLVLWEAQFGDFANGAQMVIDQFIAAGQQKWGQHCGLTLLLPHGYEGQGPEHSSARIERYLQLAAQENMQITLPSTPAQYFHLLRSQALKESRYPLVVFTPKSMLRDARGASPLEELARGRFRKVIADKEHSHKIERLILCSGKIYFDLKDYQEKQKKLDSLIIRVEQLYPVPKEELSSLWKEHALVRNICWAQEEPENQGAWRFMEPHLRKLLSQSQLLKCSTRPESASTATGWHEQDHREWEALIKGAFE